MLHVQKKSKGEEGTKKSWSRCSGLQAQRVRSETPKRRYNVSGKVSWVSYCVGIIHHITIMEMVGSPVRHRNGTRSWAAAVASRYSPRWSALQSSNKNTTAWRCWHAATHASSISLDPFGRHEVGQITIPNLLALDTPKILRMPSRTWNARTCH